MTTRITWRREAARDRAASRPRIARWLERRREERSDQHRVSALVNTWNAVSARVGLTDNTESCAGISGMSTPGVSSVVLGEPDRLMVRMLPGQTVADYEQHADRIAEAFGVARVRVTKRTRGYVRIELLNRDPLEQRRALPGPRVTAGQTVMLGTREDGTALRMPLADMAHVIVQGQTRSGKSRWTYGMLSQLAGCRDVLIGGSDITGLLARAFASTRHGPLWASGTADLEAHVATLESFTAEMDRRNATIPPHRDTFPCDEASPHVLVLIEELAGLLEAAQAADAATPRPKPGQPGPPKLADRIRAAYKRLMAEGAKAGFRVVLLVQRAEAGVVGGYARGQATVKISFRVEDSDSIRMLHSNADQAAAADHATAPAGIALISGPGLPLQRMSAPDMGDYADYVHRVQSAAAQPVIEAPSGVS